MAEDDDAPEPKVSVDTVMPWTIKSVPTHTRNLATAAARREGLTVGQWLEKRVAEWEAAGSPIPVEQPKMDLTGLADLVRVSIEASASAGIPLPKSTARQVNAVASDALRLARGLPPKPVRPTRAAIAGPKDT